MEYPNVKPFLSELTMARRNIAIQEQTEMIGVYMDQARDI